MERSVCVLLAGVCLAGILVFQPASAQNQTTDPGAELFGIDEAVNAALNIAFLPFGILNGTAGSQAGGGPIYGSGSIFGPIPILGGLASSAPRSAVGSVGVGPAGTSALPVAKHSPGYDGCGLFGPLSFSGLPCLQPQARGGAARQTIAPAPSGQTPGDQVTAQTDIPLRPGTPLTGAPGEPTLEIVR